ncbi:hypothetical protein ID866_10952 [Astraeus odoratus]|nr:hypothetical protein ID866_10952 [Astraeus odoratus]
MPHHTIVILQGWTESIRAAYGSGLLVYHIFCDSRDIPEIEHTPASSATISSFISALAGSYSGQTIQGYIYGIHAWHMLNGLPWSLHEDQINTMLKGAARLAPPSAKQDLCSPVTTEVIRAIKSQLQDNDPFNTAFFVCLTTTFYSAA